MNPPDEQQTNSLGDLLEETERLPHPLERRPTPQLTAPPPEPRAIFQMPVGRDPQFTYMIIMVNVIIFVWGFLSPQAGNQMIFQGASFAPGIFGSGEYYRLFTAMFLHGSPAHIFFNMLILHSIGMNIEKIFGFTRFALIYLLGGLTGSLLSALWGVYGGYSIGASGAVFAVLAAEGVFLYQHRRIIGPEMRGRLRALAFWSALNLALGFVTPGIDNWGHIGGLVGGGVLAWFLAPFFMPTHAAETPNGSIFTLNDVNPLRKRWWFVGLYVTFLLGLLLLGVLFVSR